MQVHVDTQFAPTLWHCMDIPLYSLHVSSEAHALCMAGCLLQATVLSDMTACCSWPQHENIHHQQFTTSHHAICIAISAYVPKQFDYHSASAQLSMCKALHWLGLATALQG